MFDVALENILLTAGDETYRHSQNVKCITEILCNNKNIRNMYSKEEIASIIFAAKYHDIGKTAIEKEILYAERKLTNKEFDIVKTHVTQGERIIRENIEDVIDKTINEEHNNIVLNIALYHHKRFDGTGYPKTDKDVLIPQYVEIVGIADVIGALTAKRCYKEPMPAKQAYNKIINGECGSFSDFAKQILSEAYDDIEKYIESERQRKESVLKDFLHEKQQNKEKGQENDDRLN